MVGRRTLNFGIPGNVLFSSSGTKKKEEEEGGLSQ
jgi:hypothetical protein